MTNAEYLNQWLDKIESKGSVELSEEVWKVLMDSKDVWQNMTSAQLDTMVQKIASDIIINAGDDITDDRKAEVLSSLGIGRKKLNWEKDIVGKPLDAYGTRKMTPGVGLTDKDIMYLASTNNMTPREFREAMSEARQDWAKKQMSNMSGRIDAQREYLYYLTLGDDTRQNEMKKKWKKDKEMMDFFRRSDKEMSGIRGWSAALARNVAQIGTGGSVVNKYAEDVLNANGGENENTLGGAFVDYPRQMATDVGYGLASIAAASPATKLGTMVATKTGKPMLKPIVSNAANGTFQGALEGVREIGSGEKLDPAKMRAVAISQATLPLIIELGGTHLSKVPVVRSIVRNARKKSLSDPISTKRQEIADVIDDLKKISSNPELNQDQLKLWARTNRTSLNDELLKQGADVKAIETDITKAMSEYKKAQREVAKIQKKLAKEEGSINLSEYSAESMDRVKGYYNDLNEMVARRSEALARLNELKASHQLLVSSQKNAGNAIMSEIDDEISQLQNILDKSDDEIVSKAVNTPSDVYMTQVRPEEQELFNIISQDIKPVNRKESPIEKILDPAGFVSNRLSRSIYENSNHPMYDSSVEDRWSRGVVSPEEEESQEYYDWCLLHPEFFSEVVE